MDEMFKDFSFNAKPENIIEEVNGLKLPKDYIEFMKEHNGGEGSIGNNIWGELFKLEELEELNNDYEMEKWWPGYIAIGGDQADMIWAYNPQKNEYAEIDLYNIDENTYMLMNNTLEGFFKNMDEYYSE